MNKKFYGIIIVLLSVFLFTPYSANAGVKTIDTDIKQRVYAVGQYSNWDGVSTVAQFTDENGELGFAYVSDKTLVVVKTKSGKVSKTINLKLKGETFGTIVCDSDGYFYVVTGTANTGDDTEKETIFISKYKSNGKLVKTVGDNGRSSLASYYDKSFNTKTPFSAGTCDAAVNGDHIAVYYGRKMYSGHQSCSAWMIDKNTMETVVPETGSYYKYSNYESHSFGQRVIPFAGGFAFMSEGDCYDRAFTFSMADLKSNKSVEKPVFDFYVKKGTLDAYNMSILNNNFAHIGNLCDIGDGKVSFVASSVKAMSSKAEKQIENVFIQIFDPAKDLSTKSAYITDGTRTGTAGNNGDQKKTNYGVKWLTSYKTGRIANPQAVADENGNTIVLYERYDSKYKYLGIYRIIVGPDGEVASKAKKVSKTALLNSCETPVYNDGAIYWCGNKYGDSSSKLYIFKLSV